MSKDERIDLTQFDAGYSDLFAFESLPALIAELKRCYEEIDGLKEHLLAAEKVVMDDSYTFYHSLEELNASE